MGFLNRVQACSVFDRRGYLPLFVAGAEVGLVDRGFAERLKAYPHAFSVTASGVRIADGLGDADSRTRAVDEALRALAADGALHGWRDEPYVVGSSPEGPPLFYMERAAIPRFGVWASGVHLNGFVRDGDDLLMWIGRRSPTKLVAPNKLDQIVAGGRSAGYSVRETLIKESDEEASIPEAIAAQAVPVGAITCCTERPEGLRRDILYIYDLELPRDFVPVNRDGELAEFLLWPIEHVLERVRDTDDFKFNCALVVIDFLIRNGRIAPDDPDYLDLISGMHVR